MKNRLNKTIALVIPALTVGGAERVMSVLANNFVKRKGVTLHLILLVGGEIFYQLDDDVVIYKPPFMYEDYPRIIYTVKLSFYLRKTLNTIKPDIILSFEGRYNSFVLINAKGIGAKCFISDRSNPLKSYGKFIDLLNYIFYRTANGIIAQTSFAAKKTIEKGNHHNVTVIGNPLKTFENTSNIPRRNVILNVGRFILSKNQDLLVRYFSEIDNDGWELWFLGEGEKLQDVKNIVDVLGLTEKVKFFGNVKNVQDYYLISKIFAFTSSSEGFPNVLGEAMGSGCACISFDCVAGPADLITHNVDGILINLNHHQDYVNQLSTLIKNDCKIENLGKNAVIKISEKFLEKNIVNKFFDFLIK